MKRVLIFAAHPDDAVLGCGGSIAKHVTCGREVAVAHLTSGESGCDPNYYQFNKIELKKIREKEARSGLHLLGVEKCFFLRSPDGGIRYTPEKLADVVHIIRRVRPDIVYFHHSDDNHLDHIAVNRLVKEAVCRSDDLCFREYKGEPYHVGCLLEYEVSTPLPDFQYVEDITDQMDLKIKAAECHQTQLHQMNIAEAIRSLNRFRGIMSWGGDYCEVFRLIRIDSLFPQP